MGRKLEDLKEFTFELKKKYKKKQITVDELRYEIAKRFGYSEYNIRSTLKALQEFQFIKELCLGIWQFVEKKTKEEAEREAKTEADALLKKVSKSNVN